jgi:adenylosuccinate synthase
VRRAAFLVVDLGFGDAGKGLVTDFLVRRYGARTVVRFNGGAQAGHNVVTPDGRHHTFAQLGAGSFVPGVRTHLAEGVVVHPTALGVEAAHLARAGVPDALERLTVDGQARVITPFHQAANRLRELARGAGRHGSCGVGVGEAVRDALEAGEEALRMHHLVAPPAVLLPRLRRVQERLRAAVATERRQLSEVRDAASELALLEDARVCEAWYEALRPLLARVRIAGPEALDERLGEPGAVVFEGAQGVLLDEWHGFHPHTTWTTCTFAPALALLDAHGYRDERVRVGVLRTYAARHGAGPLPTEAPELDALLPEAHNTHGPWQGAFRRGWPDEVLARYALAVTHGADALALTHLDALERVPQWRVCEAYEAAAHPALEQDGAGRVVRLRTGSAPDLEHAAALGLALGRVRPLYAQLGRVQPETYVERVGAALGVPVRLGSYGPRATDVRELGAL